MLPPALTAESFAKYPPEARALAIAHLSLLRQMPLAFLPSLLQEVIEYDYKFPAERAQLDGQFRRLAALTPAQLHAVLIGFWQIRMQGDEERLNWTAQPHAFTEQFSAYLWSSHQMDAFRAAAITFGRETQETHDPAVHEVQRLGIAVIGNGVSQWHAPLFEKLRPHGTYFSGVDPDGGLDKVLATVEARAAADPVPYAHWYVDGGVSHPCSSRIHQVSYAALGPVRDLLLSNIQKQVDMPGMGPERLRDYMAELTPADLRLRGDPVSDRFKIKIFTEGSGTQIYSTTFAQWTAREVLRRAVPQTLLVRFAPRQRQRAMSDLLSSPAQNVELDPEGSLMDADMATYYHWLNQQRLPGHERSAFVAWFEGQRQAIVIGPSVPQAVSSSSSRDLSQLIAFAMA